MRTIAIDAGHGGEAAGTENFLGLKEKDIALDISLRLRKLLETARTLEEALEPFAGAARAPRRIQQTPHDDDRPVEIAEILLEQGGQLFEAARLLCARQDVGELSQDRSQIIRTTPLRVVSAKGREARGIVRRSEERR